MTISFRQKGTLSETSSLPATVFMPSTPLNGSALIAVVGCLKKIGVSKFREREGVIWNLLFEQDGPVDADLEALDAVRSQIWGAFDIRDASDQVGIEFSGGTTSRGVVIAEYTGDVFRLPNPADRVVAGSGQTPPATSATMDSGVGGDTREAEELWIGAPATDQPVTFSNLSTPFTAIRDQIDIGSPGAGSVALVDGVTSITRTSRFRIDHSASGSTVNWVAVMAAIRGDLQSPLAGPEAPTVGEPVTENDDHRGDAVGHLVEQFRSHDKD
jgi:hypothetical protein